jgi:hypothetical protein
MGGQNRNQINDQFKRGGEGGVFVKLPRGPRTELKLRWPAIPFDQTGLKDSCPAAPASVPWLKLV